MAFFHLLPPPLLLESLDVSIETASRSPPPTLALLLWLELLPVLIFLSEIIMNEKKIRQRSRSFLSLPLSSSGTIDFGYGLVEQKNQTKE